jgi:predicted nucleotidyltransferase component of viral defense system
MIELRQLQKYAEREQTTLNNIVREYFQHLFLSYLYQEKASDGLLFKGGTALRIVWRSPRFSEDLDFNGIKLTMPKIETLMESALSKMENEGIATDIEESKKTSGGCLAIFEFKTQDYHSRIQIEVSLREARGEKSSTSLIQPDLIVPYTLVHLEEGLLVGEKIQACISRAKPRDFYDFYFILRGRMAFKKAFAQDKKLKSKILEVIDRTKLDFKRELKEFLPINQHMVIKNFPGILIKEIERNLA